ncbi:hypothetical protein [Clostridium phage Amboise]|nr:hypothetical protein [Clostridium phage Amboise]DAH78960.1 MAG TPA: hypothetical protein [Caudoviricetes sp.]
MGNKSSNTGFFLNKYKKRNDRPFSKIHYDNLFF